MNERDFKDTLVGTISQGARYVIAIPFAVALGTIAYFRDLDEENSGREGPRDNWGRKMLDHYGDLVR